MILTGDRDPVAAMTLIRQFVGDDAAISIFDADAISAPTANAIGYGLSDGHVRGSDVDLQRDATRFRATIDGTDYAVRTPLLGETAVYAVLATIAAAVASGRAVQPVIDALGSAPSMGDRRMAPATGRNGELVIDDSFGADRAGTASALRSLAQFTQGVGRSIAVLGRFDSAQESAVEEHDAIGRLVVRLNVRLLVAIGVEARHVQSAAGLEGSWDGEALLVTTPREAYDLVCDYTRENDVVLVKGATADLVHPVADLLSGASL
jgi:UDP-N-acetylmuramoyl-tripeptide--D-alanyl-D-alanine ligase